LYFTDNVPRWRGIKAKPGVCLGVDILFLCRARSLSAPSCGLLGEQSLQYPPPSLRATSANGGHEMTIFAIAIQPRLPIQKVLLIYNTEMNNYHRNITFMNLLFGFSIIKRQLECILISNPDRLCRMAPAAGLNPVEQTMKCFLQFDSETGLEAHYGV
jgi:hypothetical protein